MPISDDNIDLQKRACFEQILIYSILFSHVQQRLPEMEEPSIKKAILRLFLKQIVATYLSLQVGVLSDVLQFVQELVVPSRGPGVASGVPPGHGPGRRRDQPPRLRGVLARPRLGPGPRLRFLCEELGVVCCRGCCS